MIKTWFACAVVSIVMLAGAAAAMTGCSQSEEQRCQVDADCSGRLICSQSTKLCVGEGAGADGDIDAGIVIDAKLDAAIDAPPP